MPLKKKTESAALSAAPVSQAVKVGDITAALRQAIRPAKSEILSRFFKTGPGQYGEGDKFWGVMVPDQRAIAKRFKAAPLEVIEQLIKSLIHEQRLTALLILVEQYQAAGERGKKRIVDFYLRHTKSINNWDLVDLSADKILGAYLFDRSRAELYALAKSKSLWERRIAIVATLNFIRQKDLADTFKIAAMLLGDKEDLIHKACGWMIREAGKRDQAAAEAFIKVHIRAMPRTMLRYAIERLPVDKRQFYLKF